MKRLVLYMLFPISIFAQDVKVNGNSSQIEVFKSKNTSTGAVDRIAVSAQSEPQPNYGIGVKALGGFMGIQSYAVLSGAGNRYGVYTQAGNGTSGNTGLDATAYGDGMQSNNGIVATAYGDGHSNFGVNATASGNGTSYGVYGSANGTGTNYGVYCNGNGAYTGSWAKVSDVRSKKNVQDYSGALAKIMTVGVKSYEFDRAAFPAMNLKEKPEVGVIAQELEKVFPDIVEDIVVPVIQGKNADKMSGQMAVPQKPITLKGVDYIGLVPILLQAIKEQQAQIDVLKKKIGG